MQYNAIETNPLDPVPTSPPKESRYYELHHHPPIPKSTKNRELSNTTPRSKDHTANMSQVQNNATDPSIHPSIRHVPPQSGRKRDLSWGRGWSRA